MNTYKIAVKMKRSNYDKLKKAASKAKVSISEMADRAIDCGLLCWEEETREGLRPDSYRQDVTMRQ